MKSNVQNLQQFGAMALLKGQDTYRLMELVLALLLALLAFMPLGVQNAEAQDLVVESRASSLVNYCG